MASNSPVPQGPRTLKKYVDVKRYERFRAGESIDQIALSDNIDVDHALKSVRIGWQMFEAQQQIRLRELKYAATIENEEIRSELRNRVKEKLIAAVETLLDGERTVVEVNKITGEVTIHKFIDLEMVALGIEAARKAISLEEKPQPMQTMINIQNNAAENPIRTEGMSYEERMERIQIAQSSGPQAPAQDPETEPAKVVDVEVVENDTEELF